MRSNIIFFISVSSQTCQSKFQFGSVSFSACQSLWVIWCQSYPYRRTVVILFNTWLVGRIKRFISFLNVFILKVNKVAWLEFELTSFESSVKHFSHYISGTPPVWFSKLSFFLWIKDIRNGEYFPSFSAYKIQTPPLASMSSALMKKLSKEWSRNFIAVLNKQISKR